MSKSDDLLEKADAFLKRYRPSATPAREDVPVLTDVISDTDAKPTAPSAGPPTSESAAKAELNELEERLKQSILDAVGSYVSNSVEESLRLKLEAQLQRTLADLSEQVKTDLELLVRDTVARAVEREIARRRGPSRKT